ncbi:MAG TPA: ParA family protein [Gammaproteobacteria bacterium]
MTVWSVCNQKGGVGKTTTAVTLASLLAERGRKTLLIDLDPHASATTYLLGPDAEGPGILEIFLAALEPGTARPAVTSLWTPTAQPDLLLLRAAPGLAALERRCGSREGFGRTLGDALAELRGAVSHVIVDCPPTLGLLMINAIAASDRVLIPVQTEHLALAGLRRMTQTLDMVERSRGRPIERTVIATLYDQRTRAGNLALAELRRDYAPVLWREVVPIDTRLRDAARAGQPAPLYSPESRAVAVYRRLLDALLGSPEAALAAACG